MLFLLRLAFWLMLICLLLPGSPEDNRRLINSAERTVSDVRGFCQRNPDVCEDARVSLAVMLAKLRSGAELLETWLSRGEKTDNRLSGAIPDPLQQGTQPEAVVPKPERSRSSAPRLVPKWKDSLNPEDKQAPWRGPSPL
ncbi:MAG TPA: DUF5330 domain-containing protein [Hyphomicrobiales bacterium]|nr:DUF5330 domain-containing protein [Hyphomicrobiales bacterium]